LRFLHHTVFIFKDKIIKMIKNKRKYLPKQNNYNAKAKIQINKHQTKLNDKK
jgi:hypothetical protein